MSASAAIHNPHETVMRYFSTAAGAAAATIGAFYLVAWLTGHMTYRGYYDITMKANASLGLTVGGLGLVLVVLCPEHPVCRVVARLCASIALAIGLLTLLEHFLGYDFHIDQLIAHEPTGSLGVLFPNRMGPPGSSGIALTGAALHLLLMRRSGFGRAAQWCGLLMCFLGLLGLLGHLYGARELYGAVMTTIAWPTTLAILLLGMGVMGARPGIGLAARITAVDAGGEAIRLLLPAAFLLPIGLGWLLFQGERYGIYSHTYGSSILILSFIMIFSLLVYWTGSWISSQSRTMQSHRRLLEVVVNALPVGVTIIRGGDLHIKLANPALHAIAPGKEMLGRTLAEVWPETGTDWSALCREVLSAGVPQHATDASFMIQRAPDAPLEEGYFSWSMVAVELPEDSEKGILTLVWETTDRKRTEDRLRQARNLLTGIMEGAGSQVSAVGTDLRFLAMNSAFREALRRSYGREVAVGDHVGEALAHLPGEQAKVLELWRRALQGDSFTVERKIGESEQARTYYELRYSPIRDSSERIVGATEIAVEISERKAAEFALKESEEKLRLFIEHAPVALAMFDREMRYLNASRRWQTDFGLGDGDLRGLQHYELYPIVPARWREVHRRAMEGEVIRAEEDSFVRQDGAVLWLRWEVRPWRDAAGAVGGIVIFSEDISQRKQAEEELRRSEARLNSALAGLGEGVIMATEAGEVIYRNPFAVQMRGFPDPAEADGTPIPCEKIFELWTPDGRRKLPIEEWPLSRIQKGERLRDVELRLRRPDRAGERIVSFSGSLEDTAGGERLIYITIHDLTEQRTAELSLRESEEKFRAIFEQAAVGMGLVNFNDARWIDVNEAMCQMVGYTREEMRSTPWLRITHPDDVHLDLIPFQHMAVGELNHYTVEKRFIHKDGHHVWARLTLSLVRDANGISEYEIAVVEDISKRKEAEFALRREQSQLQAILDNAPLLISIKDLQGKMLLANRAIFELIDVPDPKDFIGRSVFELFPKEVAEQLWANDRRALESETPITAEETVRHQDGTWHTYLTVKFPVRFLDTLEPFGICAISMDITVTKQAEDSLRKAKDELEIGVRERTRELEKAYFDLSRETSERVSALEDLRKNEQLLLQQSRLAAMGEMLGNIAHQWRQPLNNLGLLVQDLPLTFETGELNENSIRIIVDRAMQLIKHMSRTIDDFRNFLTPEKQERPFIVNEVVTATVSLFEATLKSMNIQLEIHQRDQLVITGHRSEFSQVIMNLMTNARDAFKERAVRDPKLVIAIFKEGGKTVVTVTDNAGGIPAKIIDKIFDPYFTTKGPDKGTGIGLFMSKNIVQKSMHGALTVRNTGEGAEFRIEI